ncbi:hypothetical protein WR25_22612 [Diploscapter pachys]|uniref:Chaperone DnaJ C-terminal domain-containing protein n=1 Tax=Diploscapter pachys TaxID=2018661 RepID=A0A2A2KHX0_9BILA|nr:hypothetical protein WR25_22612 [Diploscapter pachys]
MPVLQGRGQGDLVIQIEVETPTKLSTRQRELLELFRETETGDECPESQGFFAKLKSAGMTVRWSYRTDPDSVATEATQIPHADTIARKEYPRSPPPPGGGGTAQR